MITHCVCGGYANLRGLHDQVHMVACSDCRASTPLMPSLDLARAVWEAMQTSARPVARGDALRVQIPLVVEAGGPKPRVWPVPEWAKGGPLGGPTQYHHDRACAINRAAHLMTRDPMMMAVPIFIRATVRAPLVHIEADGEAGPE